MNREQPDRERSSVLRVLHIVVDIITFVLFVRNTIYQRHKRATRTPTSFCKQPIYDNTETSSIGYRPRLKKTDNDQLVAVGVWAVAAPIHVSIGIAARCVYN
jgi:hypothetical protein